MKMDIILTKHGHHLSHMEVRFAPGCFVLVSVPEFGVIEFWVCTKGIQNPEATSTVIKESHAINRYCGSESLQQAPSRQTNINETNCSCRTKANLITPHHGKTEFMLMFIIYVYVNADRSLVHDRRLDAVTQLFVNKPLLGVWALKSTANSSGANMFLG